MKPTVADYLHQKETVRGGLQDINARVMLAIDELQRAAAISGDLLEIGVSDGQAAILLGYCDPLWPFGAGPYSDRVGGVVNARVRRADSDAVMI